MDDRNEKIRRLYLQGEIRRNVMVEVGVHNANTMASISNRLGLHWSWPLENRRSGIAPQGFPAKNARPPRVSAKVTAAITRKQTLSELSTATLVPQEAPQKKYFCPGIAVEPLHLSPAFPKPGENGLTARDIFLLSRMYTHEFNPHLPRVL